MSIKQSVLETLTSRRGESVSGEQLALQLGVSRAAIWKAIRTLRGEGFLIEAATNRGYRLCNEEDRLSVNGIRPWLDPAWQDIEISVCKEVDSTNRLARQAALDGAAHGSVFLAEQQSAGRGRFGRSFHSPAGRGIYLSLLLRPRKTVQPALLTTAAAVAVCRAVRSLTGREPQIKWVNDLLLDQKKICGILTEAVTDFESGTIESVVIGIGLDVHPDDSLPPELAQVVGSLYPASDAVSQIGRNRLVAGLLNELFRVLETAEDRSFLTDYRAWSMLLGREILLSREGPAPRAVALDIDADGGLMIRTEDGRLETLRSGEVSVRPAED